MTQFDLTDDQRQVEIPLMLAGILRCPKCAASLEAANRCGTRFTFSGHRWLFRRFDEVEAGIVTGPGIALLWSIAHMARSIGLGSKATALVTALFAWVRLLDRRAKRGLALDGASGIYFIGRRSAAALIPSDMPGYFESHR